MGGGRRRWALALQPPSEYFRENVYLTFQDDEVALRTADLVNVDRLLWANDHPHSDATWPNSRTVHDRFAELVDRDVARQGSRLDFASLYGIS